MDELRLDITGQDRIDRAEGALSEADASLAEEIPHVLQELAERLAEKAKARILKEPVHGPRQTGIRGVIAAGVGVRPTEDGAHITTSMPKADEAELPRGFDEPVRGWRHPVFGHRDRWVTQHSDFSWFMSSMQSGDKDGEQKLKDLLERAAESIAARTAS